MTPKIIELKQAPVVLVELPSNEWNISSISIGVGESDTALCDPFTGDHYPVGVNLKSVGILSDLTEDQFAECVSTPHYNQFFSAKIGPFYTDYSNQGRSMMTAKYSWDTLLESEKVYVGENPFGKDHPIFVNWEGYAYIHPSQIKRFKESVEDWKEAEPRTIDPARTVVLLKR